MELQRGVLGRLEESSVCGESYSLYNTLKERDKPEMHNRFPLSSVFLLLVK